MTAGGPPPPRAKKSFGQHFLADARAAARIAEAATTPPGGTVLEIGPGRGALTKHLLARAARVIAIERDRDLIPVLGQAFADALAAGALRVVEADAAAADYGELLACAAPPRFVAGNVPYNITGKLLRRAIEAASHVDGVVFMVQKEVADRLAAPPDGDAYGALSVFTQAAFDVKRLFVRAGAFHPPPEVDSAVVLLTPRRPPRAEETPAFRELVQRAFTARRKTLRNAWKGVFGWSRDDLAAHAREAGVDLDARGETLAVEDFARLAARAPTG